MLDKKTKQKIKNTLIYISIVAAVKFIRSLNRMQAIGLMRYIGRLAFLFAANERKKTLRHLTMAFGDEKTPKEIKSLAKQVFLNLAACGADAIRLPQLVSDGSIDRLVETENFDRFQEYVDEGKGVILMTGHFSNWELLGTWLVRRGIPLRVVAKKAYDPRLDKMIVDYRNQAGYANTARGNAMKAVMAGLAAGEVYGLLFDLDTKVKGVFVNFFGKPAHTATIPVLLSEKMGAPIVPVFIRLKKDYTYHITCYDALVMTDTGDPAADLIANTQICSDFYEKIIRRHPEQWIWMHRRWKKQPPQS